ncbi:hypothetical protein DUNSADRAFT_15328, partial [Dunaliella salina]
MIKKLQEDADSHKASAAEFSRGLDALTRNPDLPALQRELGDTVRRMAIVQIKHAKIARELEASVMSEKALNERVEALEQEVKDVSSTCRARMRWLEQASDSAKRRVEALFRELQTSAPLAAYHILVSKHARQQTELRRLLEESADQVVARDEVYHLREEMAAMMRKYDQTCDANTELKEKMRLAELAQANKEAGPRAPPTYTTSAPGEAHAHAHITVGASSGGSALAAAAGRGPVSDAGGTGSSGAGGTDLRLTQELVATKVAAEAANRRAEMMEADRDRVRRSLDEAQGRLQELEARIAQASGELELARHARTALEQRLMGAKTRSEVDELIRRLDAAEQLATQRFNDHANLTHRAEFSAAICYASLVPCLLVGLHTCNWADKQQQQILLLFWGSHACRWADKQQQEVQWADKQQQEALWRLEAIPAALAFFDEPCCPLRWADKQRQEAQCQLDLCNAGRTEAWKSKLWSRKLQQLKAHNEAMADSLDLARRRVTKQEDARHAAELKLEYAEDVGALLRKGVSEVVRDAARLHEQIMQSRIERGRLQREEVLMRERVNYAERVNAELHELIEKWVDVVIEKGCIAARGVVSTQYPKAAESMLAAADVAHGNKRFIQNEEAHNMEARVQQALDLPTKLRLHHLRGRYEAEFFQQQVDLEAEKAAALSRARSLQVTQDGPQCHPGAIFLLQAVLISLMYREGILRVQKNEWKKSKTGPLRTLDESTQLQQQLASKLAVPEDESMQLQERLATAMADLAASSGRASRDIHPKIDQGPRKLFPAGGGGLFSAGGGGKGGRGVDQRVSMDTGNRLKEQLAQAAMGDRNAMLRQIEALKAARQTLLVTFEALEAAQQ